MNKEIRPSTSVTYAIILFCTFITIFINYNENLSDNVTLNAYTLGAFYTPAVTQLHEFYRLYTSGFIHISWMHLLCNMYSFYLLGVFCESNLGHWKFFILLSVSILTGNLFLLISHQTYFVTGISGGLYGLLVFEIMILHKAKLLDNPTVKVSLMGAVIINLALNFMPNVAWLCHLGGAAGGAVVSAIYLYFTAHD